MIFELHFDLATGGKALALKFVFAEDSQFSMRPTWIFSWTQPFDPDCGWSLNLDRIFTKSFTKTSKNTGASSKEIGDAISNQRRFKGLTDCKQWLRRLTGTYSHACSRIGVKSKHDKSVSEAGKSLCDSLRLDGLDDELHARILQDLFNTLQHVADGFVTVCLPVRLSACGSHIIKRSDSCSFFCNPGCRYHCSGVRMSIDLQHMSSSFCQRQQQYCDNASVLLQSSNRVSCG